MKCKYCNADVEQEAQFCPNCGKDFSKFKKCIKCGELLDKDAVFCPHCGAEQPRKKRPVEKETSSKKWLWGIIGLLLLIGLVGGGYYYYDYYEGNNTELSDNSDSSVETELKDILSSVLSPSFELDDMHKYFTEGYINYYKRACDKADKEGYEYPRIWWQESDSDPENYTVNRIDMKSENEAVANVTLSGEAPDGITSDVFDVVIKKVNNKWLIDAITEKNDYGDISNTESVGSNIDGYDRLLSERKLTYSDLDFKSKKELELMRNSIYARYGYRFKRDDLFQYFSRFSWYNPTTSDMSTVYNSMSDVEKYNVEFIKKYE